MNGIYLDFYNDELLYSFLARYFERTGYINYISAAKDLFFNIHTRPDFEFLNKYTQEAYDMITKNKSFEQVILDHTMFKYYCRFMPKERLNSAYKALYDMNSKWFNYIPKPFKKVSVRHFRYCPICAKEDREKYGETFWHRSHQMIGVDICPIHFCKLSETDIGICTKTSPCLITAEEKVILNDIEYSENPIEKALAKYIFDVFNSPFSIKKETKICNYLHSKLPQKYLNKNMRNISMIIKDINEYYMNFKVLKDWRIEKMFTGYNSRLNEICMLSMFLNISPSQLTESKNILLKKPKRAKKKYLNAKPGTKSKDWDRIDIETLPVIIDFISESKSNNKPVRITIGYVERTLNLPSKSLLKMPTCYNEIMKNSETQDEFWMRKILWAKKKLLEENKPLNRTNIGNLTNIRKKDFDRLNICT